MDVGSVSSTTLAMASTSQPMQTSMSVQLQMLQEIAQSQQEIAQMLVESGLGQNIDVMA